MQRQQRRDFRVDFAVANPLDQANNRVILNFPKVFAFPGLEALCGFRLEKGPAFSWSVMTTPPRLCRYPGAKRFLLATQPKVERTSDKVESSPRLLRARIHFPVRENYSEPAGGLVDKGETTLIAADHLPNFLETELARRSLPASVPVGFRFRAKRLSRIPGCGSSLPVGR